MSLRHLIFLSIAVLSFLVGLAGVQVAIVGERRAQPESLAVFETPNPPTEQPPTMPFKFPEDNCDPWTDDSVPLQPLIRKWLRNEKIEEVPHCSKTAIEATAYNYSNVMPKFIDLDEDGIDEMAVRYMCSGTGNCSMNIYKRTGKSYRQIFADRQMVSHFEKRGGVHASFRDLQTRSRDSCCDGSQVLYRFDGKVYKAISCADYSYWDQIHSGETKEEPLITKRSCRKALDLP